MPADNRCEDCRRGHYYLADGGISGFPCTDENCDCWFCGPVRTPAQASARAHADLGIVDPEYGELYLGVADRAGL